MRARSPASFVRCEGEVGHVTEESTHYYSRPWGGVCIERPLSWVHRRITGAALTNRDGVKGEVMLAATHIVEVISPILLAVLTLPAPGSNCR